MATGTRHRRLGKANAGGGWAEPAGKRNEVPDPADWLKEEL